MIVTYINSEYINSITLPEKVGGQYWIRETNKPGNYNLISIEGINGQWVLKSNPQAHLIDTDNTYIRNAVLKPMNFYNIYLPAQDDRAIVFIEPITLNRQIFRKMAVKDGAEITIGRAENNDIVYANKFVSSNHAGLRYHQGKWIVRDKDSANGTYVNNYRVAEKQLVPGDTLYILGFTTIISKDFIAYNNPDELVSIKGDKFLPFAGQKPELLDGGEEDGNFEINPPDYFYRSPRFKRDIEKAVFKIDAPPQNSIGEELPFILMLGPSITMGMASMATAIFAVNNAIGNGNISSALPSIVMSSSMLLGTVLWPVISKRYEKKRKLRKENLRQEKYKEYLQKMAGAFSEECRKQEEILRENHIPITECIDRILGVQRNLWERGLGQNDFLKLRMGIGYTKLQADIIYSERRFTIDNDNLQEELYRLCETPKILNNIPITLSLYNNYVTGIIGNRRNVLSFAKGMIFQIASLYSYDEVKMVFIYDQEEEQDIGFVKWLPHVWNNDNNFRFIANSSNDMKEVSAYIEKEIELRSEIKEHDMEDLTPYYVIFALSRPFALHAEMLKLIYAKKKNIHMSVISFYDVLKNVPKECSAVVEIENELGKIFDKNDITGQYIPFTPDIQVNRDVLELSRRLANIPLDTLASTYKLPFLYTFMEMFGVGKVEHLNALARWKENDPTKSLEAPIGVDTLGDTFKLDLHEKFHGPHGLVAGMTGSGKSEFIISYILSMAVNYHPDEVAFILIDYKGGGMAKAFEKLPHTAGIITNLDGAAVKRSLLSIESELKRRQAMFAEASKKVNVSNIDIYKYQKLYREKTVTEPLPHLFIISDEFAELKTQQPDFMAKLISAARIGRSLGVHLILATQKPSGVVDDQIWSNSKFRVCLKVQERADSMDMLKRPDAAELSQTGRFYLQVGYNELFELGQSAWAGAPYYPSDKVVVEKDNSVVVIDNIGHPVKQVKIDNKRGFETDPKKQLDVITEYLSNIAKEEKIRGRQLWMEPIPALIYLEELKTKYKTGKNSGYELNPVIGELDDPSRQKQNILTLSISQEGNTVIYGAAGSGKTTFITTMIYSLIQEHSPEQLNLYIMDFASETLRAFAKAPQVGDVILSNEGERISNLFKLLNNEMERRKKLFSDYGGDFKAYVEESSSKVPSIVVIIHNFSAFTEMYEEKEEAVNYLSREGIKYGIYFVLTAMGANAVRFRLLQNFKQLLVLQMNDTTDYSTILGKTDGVLPSKYKGRGLVKLDEIYEFQIAHITRAEKTYTFLRDYCKTQIDRYSGTAAKKVPVLPDKVSIDFISDYIREENYLKLPIGVESSTLDVHYYPFGNAYIHLILSSGNDHRGFTYSIVKLLANQCSADVTVFDALQSYKEEDNNGITYYSQADQFEKAVDSLFRLTVHRNNTAKEAAEKGGGMEPFDQKVIIINSVSELKNQLSDKAKEELQLVLEKGDVKYNLLFFIAETVKNLTSFTFEKWYKKHITQKDGIWVGAGVADQYQLKTVKTTKEMNEDITADFGFAIENGKPVKIKLVTMDKEEE